MVQTLEFRRFPVKTAIFMSGSGTNAVKLLDHEQMLRDRDGSSPFQVVAIFTENKDEGNNSKKISKQYGLPTQLHDFQDFLRSNRVDRKDIDGRVPYFESVVSSLAPYKVELVVFAGYELLVTPPILSYPIVNVHPGDLSVRDVSGNAVYTGLASIPIKKAILAGDEELRSSTHLITADTDQGPPLLVSRPIKIEIPHGLSLEDLARDKELVKTVSTEHQGRLKITGDWEVLPLTVQWIAEGRFTMERGVVNLNGNPIPNGYKIDQT